MNIYILDRNTLTIGDLDFSPIEKLGKVTCLDSMTAEEVVLACKDADVLLINKQDISREMMEQLPNLKYIGVFATGFNNVDIKAARERLPLYGSWMEHSKSSPRRKRKNPLPKHLLPPPRRSCSVRSATC